MDQFITASVDGKVKIEFDAEKKIFFLSLPIFYSPSGLPKGVKEYVDARKNHSFNPYRTSYQLEGPNQVNLIQELPFQWGFQPSFREQIYAFRKICLQCHQVLLEIAIEEKLNQAEKIIFESLI